MRGSPELVILTVIISLIFIRWTMLYFHMKEINEKYDFYIDSNGVKFNNYLNLLI